MGRSADHPFQLSKSESERLILEFEAGVCEAMLRADADNLSALHILGGALTRLGRHEEALAADRRLVALAPDDKIAHYNLACSLSNLGRVDEAFDALRRSVQLGYDQADYLAKDPDLENLRGDPRFQDILERIGPKKSGKPRG